mmetsp:Transcript_2978/g.3119  ORF Transcript_2978/g.3119 Transcript_2978/m.3119 type:complete len:203 (+) Transcript_2978:101-709(+)
MTDIVQHLNEERPESLLLLGWHLFGKRDAIKCGLIRLDEKGFALDVRYSQPRHSETISYEFPNGPIKESKKIVSAFGDLVTRYSGAIDWPVTTQYVFFFIMVLLVIASASDVDLQRYPILVSLQPYTLILFRKPIVAIYILIITLIAHALEAIYVAYLCSAMVMSKNSIVTWVSMTLLFGFPITQKVMALSHVSKKRKIRFD